VQAGFNDGLVVVLCPAAADNPGQYFPMMPAVTNSEAHFFHHFCRFIMFVMNSLPFVASVPVFQRKPN
jgi:hypothetical protein